MTNDFLVTVHFTIGRDSFEIETAFTESEVDGFMQEFEVKEDHAINALSRVYLLEHYGRDASLLKAEYRKGYRT